jgi:hypothetical protein
MKEYLHHVSGVFESRENANKASASLMEKGFKQESIQIFENGSDLPISTQKTKSDEVLKDMFVDGGIGAAVGTGIGGLAGVALIAANVTLFVASPLLAPLVLLGWGASLGGTVGATIGSKVSSDGNDGWFSDFIKDAITNGQVVLVVATKSRQETDIAKKEIEIYVGSYKDTISATT